MYPAELELKHENSKNDKSASYLDLQLDVLDGEIVTSLYDKRDDFPFKIVNFPDLSGNIPQDGSYGVFIAQTLRYAKVCAKYTDFITRTLMLKNNSRNKTSMLKSLIVNFIDGIKDRIKLR